MLLRSAQQLLRRHMLQTRHDHRHTRRRDRGGGGLCCNIPLPYACVLWPGDSTLTATARMRAPTHPHTNDPYLKYAHTLPRLSPHPQATVQKTYAPGNGCNSLCRMCQQFNNYIVRFPAHATRQQRVLLLAAMIHIDYEHFEKKGGDK